MNEVFDIKRLGKLLNFELVNYVPRFFRSLLILASVIVAYWICSIVFDVDVVPDERTFLLGFLFNLAMILGPFIVYKDINNRKKGYIYALVPASTLEKLFSMLILSIIIVPVIAYTMLTATDILLYLFSRIGLGSFLNLELYNPFTDNLDSIALKYGTTIYSMPILDGILSMMQIVVGSMMFNAIFRKNKVLKTILTLMAISFISVILIVPMFDTQLAEYVCETAYSFFENEEGIINSIVVSSRILSLLVTIFFAIVTYFRIKKVNY